MIATLEFDLTERDDLLELQRCLAATDMALFIWELRNNFMRKWKHDERDNIPLEEFSDELRDLYMGYDFNINTLID